MNLYAAVEKTLRRKSSYLKSLASGGPGQNLSSILHAISIYILSIRNYLRITPKRSRETSLLQIKLTAFLDINGHGLVAETLRQNSAFIAEANQQFQILKFYLISSKNTKLFSAWSGGIQHGETLFQM